MQHPNVDNIIPFAHIKYDELTKDQFYARMRHKFIKVSSITANNEDNDDDIDVNAQPVDNTLVLQFANVK